MSTALDRPAARVDKPTEKMGQMDHFFYSALNGAEDSMAKILDNRAKVPDITKKDTSGEFIDMASVNKDATMSKYFAGAGTAALMDAKLDPAKQKGVKAADEWLANVA